MTQIQSHLSVLCSDLNNLPIINDHTLNMNQITQINIESPQISNIRSSLQKQGLNKYVNFKNIKYLSKGVYLGDLNQNQMMEGFGTIKYKNGDVFYGYFSNGKANGKGLMYYSKGQYYVGDFVQNNLQGHGFYYTQQMNYKGQFKNNLFEGEGQLNIRQNSSKFIGKFFNGQMNKGVYQWKNKGKKFIYSGQFKNNQFQDKNATLTSQSGVYKGEFKNGIKQGSGRFEFLQKYQYIGNYSNNLKNGKGTLYNPEIKNDNGKQHAEFSQQKKDISYCGEFKDNLPHGKGAIYDKVSDMLREAYYEQGIWAQLIKK